MASYRISTNPIAPTATMATTATIYSQAFDISSYEGFSLQPVWTGTPTGTFKVLVSNDGITFTDLGVSIASNPAGSASNTFIPVYGCCAKYAKLQYTNASGSGVLGGTFCGKTRG